MPYFIRPALPPYRIPRTDAYLTEPAISAAPRRTSTAPLPNLRSRPSYRRFPTTDDMPDLPDFSRHSGFPTSYTCVPSFPPHREFLPHPASGPDLPSTPP